MWVGNLCCGYGGTAQPTTNTTELEKIRSKRFEVAFKNPTFNYSNYCPTIIAPLEPAGSGFGSTAGAQLVTNRRSL